MARCPVVESLNCGQRSPAEVLVVSRVVVGHDIVTVSVIGSVELSVTVVVVVRVDESENESLDENEGVELCMLLCVREWEPFDWDTEFVDDREHVRVRVSDEESILDSDGVRVTDNVHEFDSEMAPLRLNESECVAAIEIDCDLDPLALLLIEEVVVH